MAGVFDGFADIFLTAVVLENTGFHNTCDGHIGLMTNVDSLLCAILAQDGTHGVHQLAGINGGAAQSEETFDGDRECDYRTRHNGQHDNTAGKNDFICVHNWLRHSYIPLLLRLVT